MALLLQQAHQPLAQKLHQFGGQGSGLNPAAGQQGRPVAGSAGQQGGQIEAPATLDQDLQQAVAGTAQGIGIGGAAGPLPLGIDAEQQLKPLRQGHHRAGIGAGQGVSRPPRQVMLEHRQGHGPWFALGQQVLAAHHPLQLGEFAHHLAHQIVLAEVGGPSGGLRRGGGQRKLGQQHIGAPLQPLHPVPQAAEALGEGDPRQLVTAVDAGHGAVGLEEEFRVGQAGPQHPFVAAADRGLRRRQAVANAQEAGQQLSVGVKGEGISRGITPLQGHIALVGPHHRAQHLRRQGQEALINTAHQQPGRLHQIHQLLEQGLGQVRDGCGGRRGGADGRADRAGAGIALHLHIGGGEGGGVGISAGQRQGVRAQAVTAAEAVTAQGRVAIGQHDRHHLPIQQGHKPAHRPAEAAFAIAPAHEAAALQPPDPAGGQFRQHLGGGPAGLKDGDEHERPLVGLADLQLGGIHAAAAGEALGGRGGLTLAEGLLGRRTLALLAAILLARGQALEPQGQAPWGAIDPDRGRLQGRVDQILRHPPLQLGQGRSGEIGGQLLGADLEQEGGHERGAGQRRDGANCIERLANRSPAPPALAIR